MGIIFYLCLTLASKLAVIGINKKTATTRLLFRFNNWIAEREGFEPPVQLPVHRISSAAHSTTLASFQKHCKNR